LIESLVQAFRAPDIRRKILFTLGILLVFRALTNVPVPNVDQAQLSSLFESNQLLGLLDLFSGGGLATASIIGMGVNPYINASIIMQLMQGVIPSLGELAREGEYGRNRLNQYTRLLTIPMAFAQGYGFSVLLSANHVIPQNPLFSFETLSLLLSFTAGTILLMWLGELMTEQGIGNGISLIIFAGIISQLPKTLATLGTSLFDTSKGGGLHVFGWFTLPVDPLAFWVTLALGAVSLSILYLLVKVNEAQRVITVNYAKRVQGNSSYGGIKSILPVKLIAAGVIPVIFAVAFLSLPAFVGQVLKATGNASFLDVANNLILWFQTPKPGAFTGNSFQAFIYPSAYFILVILFTYFYTGIVFNANEIAENLQNQGGFIEGIRPGQQTENYLSQTVNRLILFGSLVLGLIAVMPFAAEYLLYNVAGISNSNLSVGGTGLLIVVSVGLEALRQINSRALMVTYDDYQ